MLTFILIGSIVLSGNPGDMKKRRESRIENRGSLGGMSLSPSVAMWRLETMEENSDRVQVSISSPEEARKVADAFRKSLDAFRESIEVFKVTALEERLKVLKSESQGLYDDALEVRRRAAASIKKFMVEVRQFVDSEGSTVYTSSTVIK